MGENFGYCNDVTALFLLWQTLFSHLKLQIYSTWIQSLHWITHCALRSKFRKKNNNNKKTYLHIIHTAAHKHQGDQGEMWYASLTSFSAISNNLKGIHNISFEDFLFIYFFEISITYPIRLLRLNQAFEKEDKCLLDIIGKPGVGCCFWLTIL